MHRVATVKTNRRRREGPRLRASPVANQKGRSALRSGPYLVRIIPTLLSGTAAVEYFILFQELDGTWCAAPPSFRTSLLDPVGRGNTQPFAGPRTSRTHSRTRLD